MFLSHSSYGMPRLTPREFLNLRASRLSYKLLGQYLLENVGSRLLGSFIVDVGIWSNTMKSPSPACYMIFRGNGHTQSHFPLPRHSINSWPCYRTRPYYRLWPYYSNIHRCFYFASEDSVYLSEVAKILFCLWHKKKISMVSVRFIE